MKGVPIKFRGNCLTADKEFVYGDLIQYPYDLPVIRVFDEEECKKGLYAFDDYEVYPESVAQLVGYDADGNEVYEDDKLILGSHEYIVGIRPVSYTDDKKYYKPEKDFSDFLLKENKKND